MSGGKRVLLCELYHETHTFVPDLTGIADFRIERDDALLRRRGDGSVVDGFLEVAAAEGWTVVPAAAFAAMPSGIVDHRVFEIFWSDVSERAVAAMATGLDAVFVALHGAMVTTEIEDPEGVFLERLRSIEGLSALPLFGVFDLHAAFTERMAQRADCLVAYRENPHTDARASAMRAARLLARSLATGVRPRNRARNLAMVWPPSRTGTADSPMRELEALARSIEARSPSIWAVNVIAGFAYADVRDAGVAISAVTVGSDAEAEEALDALEALAHSLRDQAIPAHESIDAVLDRILPIHSGPVVLVEPSDNIGGGAPGDGTGILRALVERQVPAAAVAIADSEAVRILANLPIGARARLAIGGKSGALAGGPVLLEVELLSRSDGRFALEDPQSHLAAMVGTLVDMGPSAVVRHAGQIILLNSRKTPPFDLGQWRSQGIEPTALKLIAVKAAVAHRRAYDRIAAASYTVATPGPCPVNLAELPYRRIRRPIFPLDRAAAVE
ncbi:MAG: M81 family metallopeptidase [Methylobacteriaceae bacterium]|nr:M81 family metallopeptidase [Methylobacteriaceae bacterium]MBV9634320.1 M81 family metallopeptidase [Methylobacteriaceae bacterium]MBV9704830.1 M81 family metallopeptidase [Methylobacteriaceae bacterium]